MSAAAHKIRTDTFYAELTDAQRWRAYHRANTAQWYDVITWMVEEFRLKRTPSRSAFFRFLARMRDEDAAQRLARATQAVKHVSDLAQAEGLADDELVAAFKTLAAEAQINGGDTESAQRLVTMAVNLRRQALEAAKLKLDREKFESAEKRLAAATHAVTDETLTDADRVAKIKTIFGLS